MKSDELTRMLDNYLMIVPGARHAILASGDGLLRAHSTGASAAMGEPVAAAMSGLHAISRSIAKHLWVGHRVSWQRSLIETDCGWILLAMASDGTYLAVSADEETDMEALTYAMERLSKALDEALATPARDSGEGA